MELAQASALPAKHKSARGPNINIINHNNNNNNVTTAGPTDAESAADSATADAATGAGVEASLYNNYNNNGTQGGRARNRDPAATVRKAHNPDTAATATTTRSKGLNARILLEIILATVLMYMWKRQLQPSKLPLLGPVL